MAFRKSDARMMTTAWELSSGMLSFVVAIGLGYWFGSFLDGQFGTSPWLKVILLCLGLVAGLLNVYRAVSRALRAPTPGAGYAEGANDRDRERG
jgi:ATP synthase protein I